MILQDLYSVFLNSTGVCTDTRNIQKGNLFFALKGANFNGNKYATEALNKGAIAAVVDEWTDSITSDIIVVEDVLQTLSELAKWHRNKLGLPIIAITGSNGKTTTKELCASVLKQKYEISFTQGNLNNHIGVPLTLLSLTSKTEIGIIEMGANHQREIAHLCNLAQPDFGIITNIGKAHLEGFGGLEGVKKGKGEMYDYLKENDKTIFFNASDETLVEMVGEYDKSIPYQPSNYSFEQTIDNKLNVHWDQEKIRTNLTGKYNQYNIATAIALGEYFDLSLPSIKEGLENYVPQNNRSQILIKENRSFILDAYNANPSSMNESLANFSQIINNAKFLILGDMLELGEFALEEHQRIVDKLYTMDFNSAHLIGKYFNSMFIKDDRIKTYPEIQSLRKDLGIKSLPEESITLLKGSRKLKLESFLDD